MGLAQEWGKNDFISEINICLQNKMCSIDNLLLSLTRRNAHVVPLLVTAVLVPPEFISQVLLCFRTVFVFFPLFGTGGLWEPSGTYCVIYHRDNNTVIPEGSMGDLHLCVFVLSIWTKWGFKIHISNYLNPVRIWKCSVNDKPQTTELSVPSPRHGCAPPFYP
mgnify:CR=1 FL=1